MPPTRITSLMSLAVHPASLSAFLQGSTHRSTRSSTSCSNLALVILTFKCFGPEASAVMKGRLSIVNFKRESHPRRALIPRISSRLGKLLCFACWISQQRSCHLQWLWMMARLNYRLRLLKNWIGVWSNWKQCKPTDQYLIWLRAR